MKPVKLGVYRLGRDVTVYADYGGRDGTLLTGAGEIHIGLDHDDWEAVVAVAVHEAVEFSLTDQRCRFQPAPEWSNAQDSYVFHFNHAELGEMCGRVGWFLAKLLPDLATHYKRSRRGKK